MKMKILTATAIAAMSIGVAQAQVLLVEGIHLARDAVIYGGPGNEMEMYSFNTTAAGDVDVFIESGTANVVGANGPQDVFADLIISVWKPSGADYELVSQNNDADRKPGTNGEFTVYDTPVHVWNPDTGEAEGVSDPGLTANLEAGNYKIVVSQNENEPLGTLLSEGFKQEGLDGVEFQVDYTLTISGDSVSAVPVPAAVWLFGTAIFGITAVRRKKSA